MLKYAYLAVIGFVTAQTTSEAVPVNSTTGNSTGLSIPKLYNCDAYMPCD